MKSMKIKMNRKYKILLLLTVALLLATGYIGWRVLSNDNSSTVDDDTLQVTPAPATPSEEDAANKKAFIDSQEKNANGGTTDEGAAEGQDSSAILLDVKQDNENVVVTTSLQNIGDGLCTLSITNAGKTYSDNAEVIYQPSYSTCAGFSVPVASLGTGNWNISVSAKSKSDNSANKSAVLEVK